MTVSQRLDITGTTFLVLFISMGITYAQDQNDEEQPAGVVIERAALTLKSPDHYQVLLQLRPIRTLPVVAPMDGIVKNVFLKVGDSTKKQMELIRLDSQELSLELKKAQALFEVAKIEQSQADTEKSKKLLQAKLNVAQRELDLAEFRTDQTILRSAIDGKITEIHVTKGQFVRAGDLLATVIDPTQLMVEIPIERDVFDSEKPFSLTIETQTAEAKVDTVLPPISEFDPLRELFVSVATARLLVDSMDGKLTPGQAVLSSMVPRYPVAEIQAAAIKTDTVDPGSERMVQVIRDGFVRSLPVQLLGQVGQTHIFVSARFAEGDELIVSSSDELQDGSWVRPMLLEEGAKQSSSPQRRPNKAKSNLF